VTAEPEHRVTRALARMWGSLAMSERQEQIYNKVFEIKRAEYLASGMDESDAEYKAQDHKHVRRAATLGQFYRDRGQLYALAVMADLSYRYAEDLE
jgi:hypothetical protein